MLIESLGVYLPPREVSTAEVVGGCKNSVAFPLERMTGIRSRRMAGDQEFSIDLARKAIADCLSRSRFRPEEIELLICCNISRVDGTNHRTSFEPSTSIKLKHDFGLDRAVVFDVSNACAGMFTGIAVAQGYLQSAAARCALVVSGEYITHLTRTAQQEIEGFMDPRMACLTLGDSGVALTLEPAPNPEVGFQALNLFTLGRYSSYCVAKPTDREHGGAIMFTDPIKSSAVAITQAVGHATEVLQRTGWSMESCQHLIMHQTSETALNGAAREINQKLGKKVCHPGNVINNLAERGNTASTTHFVAVMDNILNYKINNGDRVAFGISGSGQTTGTALYVFDDLPERIRRRKLLKGGEGNGLCFGKSPGADAARFSNLPDAPRPESKLCFPRVRIESLGIVPKAHAGPGGTIELVKAAAKDCLARSWYERNEIELLLFSGVYRDDFICEPAIAALAAGELKINDSVESSTGRKTFAFDVFNGGLGFLNACHLGVQMIRAGQFRNAMVLASEVENNARLRPEHLRGLHPTGSALILDASNDGRFGFGNFVFKYATQHLQDFDAYLASAQGKACLRFDKSPDLDEHLVGCVPEAVEELLEKEGLDLDRIKVIFPPQVSPAFLTRLAEELDVPRERMVDLAQEKDYFTSSLVYSLQHVQEEIGVQPGDIGLIINVAAGIQVGCAIYYF